MANGSPISNFLTLVLKKYYPFCHPHFSSLAFVYSITCLWPIIDRNYFTFRSLTRPPEDEAKLCRVTIIEYLSSVIQVLTPLCRKQEARNGSIPAFPDFDEIESEVRQRFGHWWPQPLPASFSTNLLEAAVKLCSSKSSCRGSKIVNDNSYLIKVILLSLRL